MTPPCLTLSIIRYGSRVKWSNLGNGVAPYSIPRRCSYWKGSLRVTLNYDRQLYFFSLLNNNEKSSSDWTDPKLDLSQFHYYQVFIDVGVIICFNITFITFLYFVKRKNRSRNSNKKKKRNKKIASNKLRKISALFHQFLRWVEIKLTKSTSKIFKKPSSKQKLNIILLLYKLLVSAHVFIKKLV